MGRSGSPERRRCPYVTGWLNYFGISHSANIVLDPLDKELESRGHKFARYADDFVVMVKSAKAAGRVMASLIRFAEDKLKLVVNRVFTPSPRKGRRAAATVIRPWDLFRGRCRRG